MSKLLNGESTTVLAKTECAPPEQVVNFIRRVIREEKFYEGMERRKNLRYPITIPVKATPLDDRCHPAGEPFLGVTRDISIGGLCLYHLAPIETHFLQLELATNSGSGASLQVLLQVVRCLQTGPLFEIAGRFVGSE
ncbi:MAG TPA: PilZ domain-containing protein [Pirellulales bacterium]|jgi:hypothetical protein|nr:PilZ domain-containing protein [Pirellulales bacterium]